MDTLLDILHSLSDVFEIVLLDTSERECKMSSNVSICWCMTDSISAEFPLLSLAWSVRVSCVLIFEKVKKRYVNLISH